MEGFADSLQEVIQKGTSQEAYCVRRTTNDCRSFPLAHKFNFSCEEFIAFPGYVKTLSYFRKCRNKIDVFTY